MEIKEVHGVGYERLKNILKDLHGYEARVGWFENSKYEDGTQVAMVAAQNEFGNANKRIPARPFMRPTIIEKQNEWAVLAEKGAKQILLGNQNLENVFNLLGLKAVGDIKRTISKIFTPPLAAATIAARLEKRKNNTTVGNLFKPLIDTGIMLNSLISVVERT